MAIDQSPENEKKTMDSPWVGGFPVGVWAYLTIASGEEQHMVSSEK